MKIDEALKMAEEWTVGHTFHENSEGWRPAIAVMLAEIVRLRKEVDECHSIMSEDVHIEKLNYENGRLDIRGTHPLLSSLIAEVVSMFKSAGAENYFEMEGYHPDTGPLTFTIQRREGKSPGRIAQELRDELRLLKESC